MKTVDYSQIHLVSAERLRLFWLRVIRRARAKYFGRYLKNLLSIEFIAPNHSEDRDAFNAPIFDGTYSLTLTYYRWGVYRRDKFFLGSVWPCILSGVVSLVVSLIVTYLAPSFMPRLIAYLQTLTAR